MLGEKRIDHRVDFGSRHARANLGLRQLVRLPDQQPGLAHLGDLTWRTQYLHGLCARSRELSVYPVPALSFQYRSRPVENFLHGAQPVDAFQQAALAVVIQRGSVCLR